MGIEGIRMRVDHAVWTVVGWAKHRIVEGEGWDGGICVEDEDGRTIASSSSMLT